MFIWRNRLDRTFSGSREPILQLFAHPLEPVMFARCPSGIVRWEAGTRRQWKNRLPLAHLSAPSRESEEHEDSFDRTIPGEEQGAAPPRPVGRPIPLDLLIPVDPNLLPDDHNYPDQLLVLTWPPPTPAGPHERSAL
jgi:hypothetical protein